MIIQEVRNVYPNIKIWLWSGYTMNEIISNKSNSHLKLILQHIDTLVTGPFVQELRDITLPYRGSSNQEVWTLDHEKNIWYNEEDDRRIENVQTKN